MVDCNINQLKESSNDTHDGERTDETVYKTAPQLKNEYRPGSRTPGNKTNQSINPTNQSINPTNQPTAFNPNIPINPRNQVNRNPQSLVYYSTLRNHPNQAIQGTQASQATPSNGLSHGQEDSQENVPTNQSPWQLRDMPRPSILLRYLLQDRYV